MWTKFNVELEFLTRLCGGIPGDPELVKGWLAAVAPKNRPPQSKSIDEIAEEVMSTLPPDATEPPGFHVFQRVDGHCVVGMRTIRGHLKDIAQVLSVLYVGKVAGERSFAVKVKNAVYYPPDVYWVPIVRTTSGELCPKADGSYDKAIHVMTAMGPRTALKTLEYLEGVSIRFPLVVLTPPNGKLVVSEADLKTLFLYGGTHGYGPERGDGQGRYVATITPAQEEG
jgi:hypothetical protein